MLNLLFRRLTAEPSRGAALFSAITAEARQPHWYLEGGVPDTIDGRFAVLATLTALVLVRLESFGEVGDAASVVLTERFIEVMEAEHRELGLGDPTLGKTVRKLLGSLARRVESWRPAEDRSWAEATRASLYKGNVTPTALGHSVTALRDFDGRLQESDLAGLAEGRLK